MWKENIRDKTHFEPHREADRQRTSLKWTYLDSQEDYEAKMYKHYSPTYLLMKLIHNLSEILLPSVISSSHSKNSALRLRAYFKPHYNCSADDSFPPYDET